MKELFVPPTAQQNRGDRRTDFQNRFFGGPGGTGGGGGNAARGSGGNGNPNAAASRVVAVADERANALVVSAPEDYIPTIERLVQEMDVSISDITELRVFHLRNADPVEMVEIFAELFPDETKTDNNQSQVFFNRGGPGGGGPFGFRGGGGGPFGGGNRNNNNQNNANSERMKKKGRVIAVADQRTSSLIVSAAGELMPQIEEMIAQLDSSPAKKQKVFVYSLENADVQQVEQIVRDMFERNTTGNRNTANQNSPLSNRSQQNQNQGTMTPGGGFGNSGFGNQGGGLNQGTGVFR